MRILLAEDEERMADALKHILMKENYLVDVTGDGLEAQYLAESDIYDLIILDRMLPGKEGVEVLKHLRYHRITTPVIILTAKDSVVNRIEGLDAGADDYLVKPFSKEELLARIRALSRRPGKLIPEGLLYAGDLTLDVRQCLASLQGETIRLTLKECHLLEYLMQNKGYTLTREQILDKVWGFDKDVELKNVELYIFYLRKKIDFLSSHLSLNTIRGVGYCLRETKEA